MIKINNTEHPICIGNVLSTLYNDITAIQYSSIFILTDDNTNKYCLPVLRKAEPKFQSAKVICISSDEQNKTLKTVEYIWQNLFDNKADRNSVLINLGGGVTTDIGGFAAATFKRGIDFIHLPTTLLCMADACIGGKTGIDFNNVKNAIGVFKKPQAVFIDPEFLKTLPADEYKSGLAEIIKHGLIAGKKVWKDLLQPLKNTDTLMISSEQIAATLKTKISIVEQDPEEKNIRRILNFGHTIGHALESWLLQKNKKAYHGYCVAAGMIVELQLSEKYAGLHSKEKEEVVQFIRNIFSKIDFTENDIPDIIALMEQDKKNNLGKIGFVLMRDKGEMLINQFIDRKSIREALNYYRLLQ